MIISYVAKIEHSVKSRDYDSAINLCNRLNITLTVEFFRLLCEATTAEWFSLVNVAAVCGNIDILKTAFENGGRADNHTCSLALFGGHLSTLFWLVNNGCPFDKSWK